MATAAALLVVIELLIMAPRAAEPGTGQAPVVAGDEEITYLSNFLVDTFSCKGSYNSGTILKDVWESCAVAITVPLVIYLSSASKGNTSYNDSASKGSVSSGRKKISPRGNHQPTQAWQWQQQQQQSQRIISSDDSSSMPQLSRTIAGFLFASFEGPKTENVVPTLP